MAGSSAADVSVIICTHANERWGDLEDAVGSLRKQTMPPLEIIVVVDHNQQLFERVKAEMPDVIPLENSLIQGASGSRNSGAAVSRGSILAFLDDDAIASPEWIGQIWLSHQDNQVIGIGGYIEPQWLTERPAWLPSEFLWVVGGTYRGMPETATPVRNVWTGNMSIRKDVFDSVKGFRAGFGKTGSVSSPEDTDFCIRVLQAWEGFIWLYNPKAKVIHKVPANRANWRFFLARCFNEGLGKAHLASLVGTKMGMQAERSHASFVLPRGVISGFQDAIKGNLTGLQRAGSIIIGFTLTLAGYLYGWLKHGTARLTERRDHTQYRTNPHQLAVGEDEH
jgi:GT2 family glycosyltransferase